MTDETKARTTRTQDAAMIIGLIGVLVVVCKDWIFG